MLSKEIKTKILGKTCIEFSEINSTQKYIHSQIKENNIKNGTVVIADVQTDAIGTHGRKWYTNKNNIAFSLYMEINKNVKKLEGLTYKIAEILVQIFQERYNIKLEIKEPNDLMYKGKKVGGILTETKLHNEEVKYLVIGIGINITKQKFQEEIKDIATSIEDEFNVQIDRTFIITEFCNRFEEEILKIK